MAARGRWRSALQRTAAGLGLGLVFTTALAGGALLHLDLPVARRTTERALRSILDGVFEGQLEATGIDHLSLDGVAIDHVVVRDPTGVEVIRARKLRAEASVPAILRSLLLDSGDFLLPISLVRIEQADVRVEPNARGQISIAAAFGLRDKEPSPPGRPVRLDLHRIEIGAASVHGKPDGQRPLDADVRHLVGSLHVAPGSVTLDVEPTGLTERTMLPGVIAGTGDYHLRVFSSSTPDDPTPSGSRMWADFGGRIGRVEVTVHGLLAGDHVELSAHAPRARPHHVKALVPAYPLEDTVALDVDATGDLPHIDFQISALTQHNGSFGAEGWVEAKAPLRADVTFHTTQLNPRAAGPTLPDVRVTSKGRVRADLGPLVSVRIEAQTEPTSLAGTPLPAAKATAVFDGFVWSGSVEAAEPGAPLTATFATQKDGSVKFEATTKIPSLARVPRIPAKLAGAATVHTTGVVRDGKLDASVQGQVHGFRAGPSVTVRHAAVRGRVHGPVGALAVDATVTADSAVAGGYGVQEAVVRVAGPVLRPQVTARLLDMNDNHVDLAAVVDAKAAAASRVKVRVERDGAVAAGEIARIGARGGALRVDGVALASPQLGQIAGTLGVVRGELTGSLRARGVDLGALTKLLGIPRNITGKADVDIALTPEKGGRKGHLRLQLAGGGMSPAPGVLVTGVSADVGATFTGDQVTLDGGVTIDGTGDRCGHAIAKLRLSRGEGRLAGPLLDARTWAAASGHVDVAAEDFDLACLAAFVPVGLPLSEISGTVSSKATLRRDPEHRFPSIENLTLTTRYLTIVGPESFGSDEPPWSTRDLDLDLTADLDGATGDTTVTASLLDHDHLADLSFAATLDLDALADPRRRAATWSKTRIAGHLAVPTRDIEAFRTLPSPLRDQLPAIRGQLGLDAYFAGTLERPSAVVRVLGTRVRPASIAENPWAVRVAVDAAAFYDGTTATLDAHVHRRARPILTAGARVTAPIDKLTGPGPALGPWITGSARASLHALPLGQLPVFRDRDVDGHLSGDIVLDDLGKAPSLRADLTSNDLRLGPDVTFHDAHIGVRTQRDQAGQTTAVATVRLREREGGALDATGYLGFDFRAGLVPVPQTSRPADVLLHLGRFPIASAEPFLGGALRKLGGTLEGDVRVGWRSLDDTDEGAVQCDLRLDGGTFYVPQIGQDLRLTTGDGGPLRIAVDPSGAVRIDDLALRASTGEARGSAQAQLAGLGLRSATLELTMPDSDPLPITFEGVALGDVSGRFVVTADRTAEKLAVKVAVPELRFKIPTSTSRDVQSLDEHPDIALSHTDTQREPPPPPGLPLEVIADLDDVLIEGSGVRITLASADDAPPTITVHQGTRSSGTIKIVRGTVELMGRKFEIDQGLIFLQEDVSNPYLNITAHWDAPDGSDVFIDVVGTLFPLTRDKLRFRSSPPRGQQEIISLLLFGSETGGAITTGGATPPLRDAVGNAAVGIGGELVTQQINQLFKGIAPLRGLRARFGTTDEGAIQTSLVYQLGDTLSAAASYENSEQATTATNPSGGGQGASLSIDWRFRRNWVIRATVGAINDMPRGEIDLLWQYKY